MLWLIAAKCFLKELGLSIASWEVHKNPANRIGYLKLFELLCQRGLLSFESLDLLLLEVFLLKLRLNCSQSFVDLDLATSLLLDLILFLLRALVGILDSQLGNEDFDIELIADFLAIKEKFLHLEAALSEFFHEIELLVLVLAHGHVAELLVSLISIL